MQELLALQRKPKKRWLVVVCFAILVFDLFFCTLSHELGHGLTTIAFGGQVTYLEVAGFRLYPNLEWLGPPSSGAFGICGTDGIHDPMADAWISLAGALGTWIVSVLAAALYCIGRFRGAIRLLLFALGLWWLDMFLYTIPSFGVPRYVFWGPTYSEPYDAAVDLGVPGPLFQILVITSSTILATVWLRKTRQWMKSIEIVKDVSVVNPST